MSLIERDKKHVWHPFTQHHTAGNPLAIVKGEGIYLIDETGKKYIDANSSWWVNTHGHGHPHLGKALQDQFEALDHVIFAGVTHPKAVELSERLVAHLPSSFQKVFFSDNGSTAVEVALKMAFQFFFNRNENRDRILAMHGAYHGDTFGAMSVGQRDLFNKPFEPFFFDVDYLDFPAKEREAEVLRRAETVLSTHQFAALIVEPLIQGAAGMQMYSVEFLDQLTIIAKRYGTLVIFDEVMTGFGRTGKMFAMDYCTEKPDIVALSKGLTAGILPMGVTVTSEDLFQSFLSDETARGFLHGHSYTGNPLACAIGCASLDLFDQQETWRAIQELSSWNHDFREELEAREDVENVRQSGTILAFDVILPEGSSYFSTLRDRAYAYFVEHGVLMRPLGNVIFINPPYSISKEEHAALKNVILAFLDQLD